MMRFATYNVEWFDGLFDEKGELIFDDGWSGRFNVTRCEQLNALGVVFSQIDPDVIMVIEAPDQTATRPTAAALGNFARHFGLRQTGCEIGFSNDTQQEIAVMFDPGVCSVTHTPFETPLTPRFDRSFEIDLDIDNQKDTVKFSKPPAEMRVVFDWGDVTFVGVHLKSKAPHGARDRDHAMQISINNRRKQLAQAIWLRQRSVEMIEQGHHLILAGDFNDGPGLDIYENLFGRSSIEIISGAGGPGPILFDPNAKKTTPTDFGEVPFSARFFAKDGKVHLDAMLDYIFISPSLAPYAQGWQIWNPYLSDYPADLANALRIASDHFPVTLDILPR